MIASKFDPLKNGLPYKNGTFKFWVGPASCTVLCGGISYTALDYFFTGIQPPQLSKIPLEGNPMETYLYRRQMTAHFYTWHRFTNAWSVSQIPGIRSLIGEQDELGDLCKYLPDRPVIICLFGGPFHGHHVVASACEPTSKTISLYDSNHPGKISYLKQVDGGWYHSESHDTWKGWFMDWGHYTEGTKMPPLAFRYCRRCHGLNTSSLGTQGSCLDGVPHDNNLDFEYFLPWQAGVGQSGWKVCSKCLNLFRQTADDVPFCPAIGLHLPQKLNNNWQDLSVMTDGTGEPGWRRCTTCTSLFFVKDKTDFGKCSGGDPHSPAANETYVVDNRTV